MINLKLGDIFIKKIDHSSGFFWGKKNTYKKFYSGQVINEVVGVLSGHENKVINSYWIKTKQKGGNE